LNTTSNGYSRSFGALAVVVVLLIIIWILRPPPLVTALTQVMVIVLFVFYRDIQNGNRFFKKMKKEGTK
jgi:hypothetical protein